MAPPGGPDGGPVDGPVGADARRDPSTAVAAPAAPPEPLVGPSTLIIRPPRAPLAVIAVVAGLTVPLAVVAVASGDVLLGMAALVSAGWAATLAALGWTAWSRIDAVGVAVHWMRSTRAALWADVRGVEVERGRAGGAERSARIHLVSGAVLRLMPWLPILWFARRGAPARIDALGRQLAHLGTGLTLTDPGAAAEGGARPDLGAPRARRSPPDQAAGSPGPGPRIGPDA